MPARNDMPQNRSERHEDIRAGFRILQEGDIEGAREIFTALLEEDPGQARAHMGLGKTFLTENDPTRALEHFQEAIALDGSISQAHFLNGEAYSMLGETDAAIEEYEAALALDPTRGIAAARKARLLANADRPEDARSALAESVRRNPQDPGLRISYAKTLASAGEAGLAEAEFRRAIDLQPDAWPAHFGLGTALLRGKKHEEARDALVRAAKLAPDKAAVHQALGVVYTALGEHNRAARAYDESRALDPRNIRATLGAALARSAAGQYKDALEVLRSVGRRGSRLPPVQKALGDIYLAMERPADALETYRAMILNSKRLGEASPDLLDLANAEDSGDVAAMAARLKAALEDSRSSSSPAEGRTRPARANRQTRMGRLGLRQQRLRAS